MGELTRQLKKIAFLVPRRGLSEPEFRRYWRQVHGPLVAGSPGYATWRTRYVQNHILGPGPVGLPFAYSGIAAFWLPGDQPNEDSFSTTSIYRDRIRVDEAKFIDMERTVSMSAYEEVLVPGRAEAKLVILSRQSTRNDEHAFQQRYRDEYARAALDCEDFGSRVVGWRVNHVIEGTSRLPGARPGPELGVECIEELWFDSSEALNAAFACESYRKVIRPAADGLFVDEDRSSFIAAELVFFEDGAPVS